MISIKVAMKSIKESLFYSEVSKELNFPFGDFYFFDGFLVAEIKEGTVFSWDNVKVLIKAVIDFYRPTGFDIVYISNRIHNYSINPTDWLKFTSKGMKINGFAIVSKMGVNDKTADFESLFVPANFKVFDNVLEAIQWAASIKDFKEENKSQNG